MLLSESVYRDNVSVVLIDFDNFFANNDYENNNHKFEQKLIGLISYILNKNNTIKYLYLRLYGAWYSNGVLNNRASTILSIISNVNIFPIIYDGVKILGRIEISNTMYGIPDKLFNNTLKEKRGLSNIRVNQNLINSTCPIQSSDCPAKILQRFAKGKQKQCHIEGCSNINEEIFVTMEQKMVDTWIACDIIALIGDENINNIIIISNDFDLVPPIFYAVRKKLSHQEIYLVVTNSFNFGNYKNEFENTTVNIMLF
jgi:hypothetical protein